MIPKIKEFLGLCNHKWNTFDVAHNVDTAMSNKYGKQVIVGQIYYQECVHCGKIRKKAL